jgi:hypothetical protein
MKQLKRSVLAALAFGDNLVGPDNGEVGTGAQVGISPGTIDQVRQALADLDAAGTWDELQALGSELYEHQGALRQSLLVFADVLESLVQDAEGRHPQSGRGGLKLKEVKWVVAYLLNRERIDVPGLPKALQPFFVDVFTDVAVNALVAVLNDHELLKGTQVSPAARRWGDFRWWLHALWRWLSVPLNWIWQRFGSWLSSFYVRVRFSRPASPTVRFALASLGEQESPKKTGALADLASFVSWLAHHHEVVTAFARIVSIAVTQAERFVSLDGRGKKQYAENTIMAVLGELGIGRGIISSVLVRAGVDMAIDMLVAVFNKRDYFVHRTAAPS